jgi:hypothetical protein
VAAGIDSHGVGQPLDEARAVVETSLELGKSVQTIGMNRTRRNEMMVTLAKTPDVVVRNIHTFAKKKRKKN